MIPVAGECGVGLRLPRFPPACQLAQGATAKAVVAGQFKTLAAALKAAGLVDTLNGAGPFTVFAHTKPPSPAPRRAGFFVWPGLGRGHPRGRCAGDDYARRAA